MCNSVPQKLPKCLFPISFTSCSQRSNYALEWFVNHSHAFLSFNIVLRFNHVNALVFAYSFFFSIYYLTVWTYHHLSILLLMNFGLFPVGIFVCFDLFCVWFAYVQVSQLWSWYMKGEPIIGKVTFELSPGRRQSCEDEQKNVPRRRNNMQRF